MMWWPAPLPWAPDRLEHLLIPQLSLAFLSSSPAHPYPGKAYRRLLLDNAVSADLLRPQQAPAALLPKDHQRPDG